MFDALRLTTQGIEDLRLGVIRTPLHPVSTLLDDPLRALRAIRFASKLRFRVADDLAAGLATREVHVRGRCTQRMAVIRAYMCVNGCWVQEALAAKVSRERIGTEVDKALAGVV